MCLSTSSVAGSGLIKCDVGMLLPNDSYVADPIHIFAQYTVAAALTIYVHAVTYNYSGSPTLTNTRLDEGSVAFGIDYLNGELRAELVRY